MWCSFHLTSNTICVYVFFFFHLFSGCTSISTSFGASHTLFDCNRNYLFSCLRFFFSSVFFFFSVHFFPCSFLCEALTVPLLTAIAISIYIIYCVIMQTRQEIKWNFIRVYLYRSRGTYENCAVCLVRDDALFRSLELSECIKLFHTLPSAVKKVRWHPEGEREKNCIADFFFALVST